MVGKYGVLIVEQQISMFTAIGRQNSILYEELLLKSRRFETTAIEIHIVAELRLAQCLIPKFQGIEGK